MQNELYRRHSIELQEIPDGLSGRQYCVKVFAVIYVLHLLLAFFMTVSAAVELIEDSDLLGGQARLILIFVVGSTVLGLFPLNCLAAWWEDQGRWFWAIGMVMPVIWYWDRKMHRPLQDLTTYEWRFWYGFLVCFLVGGTYIFAGLTYLAMLFALLYAFILLVFCCLLLIYGCFKRFICKI